MDKYAPVEKNVLAHLAPKREEQRVLNQKLNVFIKRLVPVLPSSVKPVLGGSVAKGTWLSGTHDADIFVVFEYKKYHDAALSDHLEVTLKKLKWPFERLHGSRDYFQLK